MKYSTPGVLVAALVLANLALAQQEPAPVINIKVSRSVKTVTYRAKGGETKVDFQGTALQPRAEGVAKVESKQGRIAIHAEFEKLEPAIRLGDVYLTYVLWAISPEGAVTNLGEIVLDGGKGKITVTAPLQAFAMIVTAEPYFAVSFPSELVVLENIVRSDTVGKVDSVDAKFELLQRGQYEAGRFEPFNFDSNTPLDLYQARNAVRIARSQQADRYAEDSFTKAEKALRQAEDYHQRKDRKSTRLNSSH